jgi:hypothetical protein
VPVVKSIRTLLWSRRFVFPSTGPCLRKRKGRFKSRAEERISGDTKMGSRRSIVAAAFFVVVAFGAWHHHDGGEARRATSTVVPDDFSWSSVSSPVTRTTLAQWLLAARTSSASIDATTSSSSVSISTAPKDTAAYFLPPSSKKTTRNAVSIQEEEPKPHQAEQQQLRRRSLFGGYTNVICALTEDTYPAIWDDELQLYYFPDLKSRLVEGQQQNNNTTNATSSTTDDSEDIAITDIRQVIDEILAELETSGQRYELVRLCWCTQYAQLPYEFCPAQFDTCQVGTASSSMSQSTTSGLGGTDDTITTVIGKSPVMCYSGAPRDTLIRSFWPVLLFCTAAVFYAWFCSAHGRLAHGFLVRRVCCCCFGVCGGGGGTGATSPSPPSSTHNNANSNNTGVRQLDALLRSEPERASAMYQHYLHRSRTERERRRARQDSWWYRRLRGTPIISTSATSGRNNNNSSDDASLSEETRLKLTLKTKIFHDDDELLVDAATRRTASASDGNEDSNDNGNNDDDDDDAQSSMSTGAHCVICLLRLADGDVIGDISCGHLLHKDCLKDWVRRKNKCPLCQHAGIATLSLERVPVTTTTSGGSPSTLSSSP